MLCSQWPGLSSWSLSPASCFSELDASVCWIGQLPQVTVLCHDCFGVYYLCSWNVFPFLFLANSFSPFETQYKFPLLWNLRSIQAELTLPSSETKRIWNFLLGQYSLHGIAMISLHVSLTNGIGGSSFIHFASESFHMVSSACRSGTDAKWMNTNLLTLKNKTIKPCGQVAS